MTRDTLIKLAREAGLAEWHESIQQDGFRFANSERLERFAALVSAAEREACAKTCEAYGTSVTTKGCAAAIRARG